MKSLKIGITGGIGSGKSTVCQILEAMGYPVFYSDKEARYLQENNTHVIAQIKSLFGEDCYENGQLKRKEIAQNVFSNPLLLEQLNQIVHPAVRESFEHFTANLNNPFVFNEAAILLQTDAYKNLDATILVTAPDNIRVQRVMERDNISEHEVNLRIQNQMSQEQLKKLTPYQILNDGKQLLIPQIVSLLKTLDKLRS